jgi:excisionase family DNA binding protein
MPTTTEPRPLLSVAEVAVRLNVSRRLIEKMVAARELPVVRVRKRTLVDPRALEEWIAAGGSGERTSA